MKYKITGGQVMTYVNGVLSIEKRDIYVVGDTIRFMADGPSDEYEVIDAADRLVMPGLILSKAKPRPLVGEHLDAP